MKEIAEMLDVEEYETFLIKQDWNWILYRITEKGLEFRLQGKYWDWSICGQPYLEKLLTGEYELERYDG